MSDEVIAPSGQPAPAAPAPLPGQPPVIIPPAPAPAPQPAPAPAPQPAPAPVAPAAPGALEDAPVAEYDGTGDDPGVQYTANLIQKAGFNAQSFMDRFVEDGGKFHPAVKEKLVAKMGEQAVAFVEHQWAAQYQKSADEAKTLREGLIKDMGGEENWKAIQGWAATAMDATQLASIRNGLADPNLRPLIAEYLKTSYAASGGTVQGQVPRPSGQPAAAGGLQPISRAEYSSEYSKAYKAGDRSKMAELDARRRASMSSGL